MLVVGVFGIRPPFQAALPSYFQFQDGRIFDAGPKDFRILGDLLDGWASVSVPQRELLHRVLL